MSNNRTILVADDEQMLRRALSRVLSRAGFSAIVAEDGQQAIDIFTQKSSEIDLVVLDMNMPVKNAYEVLVADIFYGRKEKFVSTSGLLTSWKIWTPMLKDYDDESKKVHEPVIYGFGGKEVFDSVREKWQKSSTKNEEL